MIALHRRLFLQKYHPPFSPFRAPLSTIFLPFHLYLILFLIQLRQSRLLFRFGFFFLLCFFSFLFFRDAALEKFASKTGRNINTRGILFVLYARLQSKSSQPCLLSVVSSFFFLFCLLFILPRSYSRLETAIIIALLC